MKYELIHDSIAQLINDKASLDAKTRRRVEAMLARALERYQQQGVLLRVEDLDEIKPFEQVINLRPEERQLIRKSREVLEAAARRKRRITWGIIAVLSLFLLWALFSWRQALISGRTQKAMRLSLQADQALDDGLTSLGFRLISEADLLTQDTAPQNAIREVLERLVENQYQADLSHEDLITAIDWSKEQNIALTASLDGSAKLWNTDGELQQELLHQAGISDAAFLPWSDDQLVTVSLDSTARIWRQNGDCLDTIRHPGPVTGLALNAKFPLWLTISDHRLLRLLDHQGQILTEQNFPDTILQAEFAPGGKALLVASPDRVQVFEILLNRILHPRLSLDQPVRMAHFIQSDPLRTAIFLATPDQAQVYNIQGQIDTSTQYAYLNDHLNFRNRISGIGFSTPARDKAKIIFSTPDSTVFWWSVYENEAGSPIDFTYQAKGAITFAGFSQTDRFVIIAETPGVAGLYQLSQKDTGVDTVKAKRLIKRYTLPSRIQEARFSANDDYLLTSHGDHTAHLWHIARPAQENVPLSTWIPRFRQKVRALKSSEKEAYGLK